MKFIVDAQLPPLLCKVLEKAGLSAIHVDSLPKGDKSSDTEIIDYADENQLIIVTKDSDFYYSHMIKKQPRKLLLVTTGNLKNSDLFSYKKKKGKDPRKYSAPVKA
jgi:predicted nuclease of predicted toxin-antitoxin system